MAAFFQNGRLREIPVRDRRKQPAAPKCAAGRSGDAGGRAEMCGGAPAAGGCGERQPLLQRSGAALARAGSHDSGGQRTMAPATKNGGSGGAARTNKEES